MVIAKNMPLDLDLGNQGLPLIIWTERREWMNRQNWKEIKDNRTVGRKSISKGLSRELVESGNAKYFWV